MSGKVLTHGSRVEGMKPHEPLLVLGGFLAVLLGSAFFAIQWSQGIPSSRLADQLLVLVVDVLMGVFLWIVYAVAKGDATSAGIMALSISFVLMIFGGTAGLIGGLVGLLAGILAIVLPYLPVET